LNENNSDDGSLDNDFNARKPIYMCIKNIYDLGDVHKSWNSIIIFDHPKKEMITLHFAKVLSELKLLNILFIQHTTPQVAEYVVYITLNDLVLDLI